MATYYQNGFSWYIQYRRDGRRIKERVGKIEDLTKQEVALLCKAKELGIATNAPAINTNSIADFVRAQYLPWYETEFPASIVRTRGALEQHLLPVFGSMTFNQVTKPHVEAYKHARRAAGARAATIIKELRILQAVFNRAVEWGVIFANQIRGVKPPRVLDSKPPEFYGPLQLMKLYEVDPIHAHIWRLMANTGLRRAEALNLRKADVLVDRIRILSTESNRTKSTKWREVPLTPNAAASLEALSGPGEHVLPRMAPESLTRAFLVAATRAALPGSLHTLRHTYISHLIMAGVPLRTVQVLAGHASYVTTEKYAHLAPGHLEQAGRVINL